MSLFYPDVVIGRPGAGCDALEAQNMIVCIPGARRCYQRAWRVDLGCWIYVHNLRDCAKMDEMLRALLFAPHTSHLTPHTSTLPISHVISQAANLERRPVAHNSTRLERLTLPTSSVTLTASHYPLRASARRNKRLLWQICRFLRCPKLGARARWGVGAPVNDNHYRYRLQTGTSMIIVVIYIHKPK